MDENIKKQIDSDVKNNKVMLYMKGTPQSPMCGFSARAVAILQEYNIPFKSFNVFDNESIRQGIKEYADWPTIPQIYINGEFIGGCDILTELHTNHELGKLLGVK